MRGRSADLVAQCASVKRTTLKAQSRALGPDRKTSLFAVTQGVILRNRLGHLPTPSMRTLIHRSSLVGLRVDGRARPRIGAQEQFNSSQGYPSRNTYPNPL